MDRRGYQADFYTLSEGVRDLSGRRRKAEKIAYLLKTFSARSLETAICLDVGCSSGFITAELAPLFAKTIGVEYDAIALQHAPRDIATLLTFVRGDAMRLPVAPRSVDVVICAQVYEHVPDDERMVAEIYRVLRPGGLIFFSGPNKLYPIEPHYFLPLLHWLPERWANAYLRLFHLGDHYYERSRTLWSLKCLFTGFEIRDVTVDLLQANPGWAVSSSWAGLIRLVPRWLWRVVLPILPNFNWILFKPYESQ